MPLKLKDNGEDEAEDKQNHGPILHQPGIQPHISHSLIITVILVVLLAVAGYAIYKSGVWKNLRTNGAQQAPQTAVQVPAAEPAPAPSPDTLRTAAGSVEQPASPAAQEAVSGGGYTIFVSRQKERARADEET